MHAQRLFVAATAACLALSIVLGSDTPPPAISSISASNGVKTIQISPSPGVDQYTVRSSGNVAAPFTNDASGALQGLTYRLTNSEPFKFYSVAATPMSSNSVLVANLLNRIAFGPTPDDLQRVAAMGPDAYIAEQLAPETVVDTLDTYSIETTNGVSPSATPVWRNVSVTGTFSSSNLYIYLLQAGDTYIDDIELRPILTQITTNVIGTNLVFTTNNIIGTNVLWDGGFEDATLTPSWNITPNVGASAASTAYAHSGNRSLHLVCAAAGSAQTDSLWQAMTNLSFPFNTTRQGCQLSFWYLESPTSSQIKIRLNLNGVNASGNDQAPTPQWIYATATGRANATTQLYIYLNGSGECFIDDIKLVPGTVAGVGTNLLRNGDFEAPLGTNWLFSADFTNSYLSSAVSHSGSGSLKVVATAAGTGTNDSVYQSGISGLTNNATYTASFWYLPPTRYRTLTVRLSSNLLVSNEPSNSVGTIRRRLDTLGGSDFEDGTRTVETIGGANLFDLRAWFVMNCVGNKRQLLQVLLQFLENHFVTQHTKSVDYFDRFYDDSNLMDILATDWEYREQTKWRNALLRQNCTFYDLLRISAESPAMIVYLDSVDSNGSGNSIANENYAREIMELFCMGVDNGYDQQDITVMSRAWSGWSVDIVDPWNINNPHAPRSQRVGFYPGVGSVGTSNLVGAWTFNYKTNSHGTNRAPVWSLWDTNTTNPKALGAKTVPARFGPPWAGQPYALYPANAVPVRTGTNGINDGYAVLAAIADLPFTMEFISVKLCRLFVHDDFEHGTYDYTDPNRSPEADLVRQCMVAWNTPAADGRKGNIRSILNVIFSSDLFRSQGSSMQKVKTPLEFAVSAIRALHASDNNGGYFSSTDGYSIVGRSRTAAATPLARMGSMMLFDRDAPDGYPEVGPPWISAGTLAERVRYIQTTLMAIGTAAKTDGISGGNLNVTDPVGLLKSKLPSAQLNDAGLVADYFLGILFPGEGRGNLGDYRTLAVNFLNTADDSTGATSQFSALASTGAAYDTRIRAMVSMLMTEARFQEQ